MKMAFAMYGLTGHENVAYFTVQPGHHFTCPYARELIHSVPPSPAQSSYRVFRIDCMKGYIRGMTMSLVCITGQVV